MKLSRQQVDNYNSKCSNGFKFDLRYFCFQGEKAVHRYVPVVDGELKFDMNLLDENVTQVVEFTVWWTETRETKTNEYGVTYRVPTGLYLPQLYVHLWNCTPSFKECPVMRGGMGEFYFLKNHTPAKRRQISYLCKVTEELTNEVLESYWKGEHNAD